jgi:hypothetical protein
MPQESSGLGDLQSASPPLSSTVYSNGTDSSSSISRVKSDQTIEVFIRSLGGPTDHLLQLFREMEIDSAEHLNWICQQQEDYWDDVKDYLLKKGVSLFHWLVVKKGLRERKASLAGSSKTVS